MPPDPDQYAEPPRTARARTTAVRDALRDAGHLDVVAGVRTSGGLATRVLLTGSQDAPTLTALVRDLDAALPWAEVTRHSASVVWVAVRQTTAAPSTGGRR